MDVDLSELDEVLKELRANYYFLLQNGVSEDTFEIFTKTTGYAFPEELKPLYRWKNGQDPNSSDPIQDNRTFMTLEELTGTKQMLDAMIGTDFEDPEYWKRDWIPFLHNGGGSYLCFDLGLENPSNRGRLIGFWKTDRDRPMKYRNIKEWVNNVTVSTKNGTIELN